MESLQLVYQVIMVAQCTMLALNANLAKRNTMLFKSGQFHVFRISCKKFQLLSYQSGTWRSLHCRKDEPNSQGTSQTLLVQMDATLLQSQKEFGAVAARFVVVC